MPWKTENVMDLRIDFVLRATRQDVSFSDLCREFGISRPTGYLWLERYQESGSLTKLVEKSRRPLHSPNKTSDWLEREVIELRGQYGWGARKIQVLLARQGYDLPEITINRIIKRNGFVCAHISHPIATKRFQKKQCNELFQMDFKGEYPVSSGKCYPLSLIDDKSRYLVGLWALASQKSPLVKEALESVFVDIGVPKAMLMDHGTPWWSNTNGHGLTWLSVWLIKQGIRLIYSGIRHPQTQGKVERFHKTLDERTRHRGRPSDLNGWIKWAAEFRQEYNELRPHEALDMQTPSQIYRSENLRAYVKSPIDWDYGDARTRVLNSRGFVDYGKDRYFVCEALAGDLVRVDDLDGILLITFRNTVIREIDLRTGRSKAIVLPAINKGANV